MEPIIYKQTNIYIYIYVCEVGSVYVTEADLVYDSKSAIKKTLWNYNEFSLILWSSDLDILTTWIMILDQVNTINNIKRSDILFSNISVTYPSISLMLYDG